jgi:WhiB family redox-sensing transcriptional regulator
METFFPEPVIGRARHGDKGYAPAQAICAECPVLSECREYAVAIPALRGIWGGLTESGRHRARHRR